MAALHRQPLPRRAHVWPKHSLNYVLAPDISNDCVALTALERDMISLAPAEAHAGDARLDLGNLVGRSWGSLCDAILYVASLFILLNAGVFSGYSFTDL